MSQRKMRSMEHINDLHPERQIQFCGVLNASFSGCDEGGIYIRTGTDTQKSRDYKIGLYDGWYCRQKMPSKDLGLDENKERIFYVPFSELDEAAPYEDWKFCIGWKGEDTSVVFFLRKEGLSVSEKCRDEMYDRRELFGIPGRLRDSERYFLPYYLPDGILAAQVVREDEIYKSRFRNEIRRKLTVQSGDKQIWYTECKKIRGSYIGLLPTEKGLCENKEDIIFYDSYEEDDNLVYMSFELTREMTAQTFDIVWTYHGKLYRAPLTEKKDLPFAEITDVKIRDTDAFLTVFLKEGKESFREAWLVPEKEIWEKNRYISLEKVNADKTEDQNQNIVLRLETEKIMERSGKWQLRILAEKGEKKFSLPVIVQMEEGMENSFAGCEIRQKGDTKVKVIFSQQQKRLTVESRYTHNALKEWNRQDCSRFLRDREILELDEFLTEDVGPAGKMCAEFEESCGALWIKLYQEMRGILEARLVMFHTQGMGIMSVQPLKVTEGKVEDFPLILPDSFRKTIKKPINSIWFRIAIAVRRESGIWFTLLQQYDKNPDQGKHPVYDIRDLYMRPVGEMMICGIRMLAVPYYSETGKLSIKYVRQEQLYRSQFTNELLDVRIKHDILTVKMRCRDCGGTYKGVLLEYRKEKEDDAQTYLIPYESLVKEKDTWIMTTRINLKQYYLRMLYWDIRCAFEKDGNLYHVSCHSENRRFLRKYKNILVDRAYPTKNSILFPYATANHSVALMHREICPQDFWQFRVKERIAMGIYKILKRYWDKKNIYLVFEKYCVMAQDNGYYFFQYCMDNKVEKEFGGRIYYILDRRSADWEKLKPYRSHVVKFLSVRHMIYLLASRLLISTDTKGHAYVWRSMGSDIKAESYKKKLVFLQHGVTAFKRGHFERGTNVGCECFITTSEFEHDIIRQYLGYPEEEIPITGFARWDVLCDKSAGCREILLMPTWRTWLDDAENEVFAKSYYCQNYMTLLNNPKLDELLKRHDIILNFYLHPKFRKYITEFSVVSDHIRLIPFGTAPLNELMMQCRMLITDFSSVAWDVYYMKKPVIFYHFDLETADKTLGFYMDMKKDIFGDRAETPDELLVLIEEYIENGFQMKQQYIEKQKRYFAYIDNHNSERIWKAIREREW